MSARPVLRVVSGDATPEEIAAVVAAVAAAPAAGPVDAPADSAGTTSRWGAPGHAHRSIRASFAPSRDGWRTSFWPR